MLINFENRMNQFLIWVFSFFLTCTSTSVKSMSQFLTALLFWHIFTKCLVIGMQWWVTNKVSICAKNAPITTLCTLAITEKAVSLLVNYNRLIFLSTLIYINNVSKVENLSNVKQRDNFTSEKEFSKENVNNSSQNTSAKNNLKFKEKYTNLNGI